MSKWQVQNWGGDFLEVEADSVATFEGALIFSRRGHQQVILADGSWMTAHDDKAVIRTLSAPRVLDPVRPLAAVVDLVKSKEQG